jgi:hypothetical protein
LASLKVLKSSYIFIIFEGLEYALIEKIVKEITERDKVILSAGGLEVQLTDTSEHQVTSEGAQLFLLNVVSLVGLKIGRGKSEINNADGTILKATLVFVSVGDFVKVRKFVEVGYHNIVKFKIIIYVSSLVNLLKNLH